LIDLGLTKLAVIGAVALVVIGPERLPTVARVTGRLYGKLQGYLSALKSEVNLQMQADKLKEQMAQQAKEVSEAAKLNEVVESVEPFRSVADDLAEAERDYSHEIAVANRSFGYVRDPNAPLSDSDLFRKQREFQRKKRRSAASPPVWFNRQQQRRIRLISTAARQARLHPTHSTQASKG
jgi:sec-independent protein translocase protein TatB